MKNENADIKGLYCVLEAIDGAGKTTVINELQELIKRLNPPIRDILYTREPGGCKISEQIRSIILDNDNTDMDSSVEAQLFCAARTQSIKSTITPALIDNKIVISDRSVYTSIVYQGICRENGVDTIIDINKRVLSPDIIFVLNIDTETALSRLTESRGLNRLDLESDDFYNKANIAYQTLDELIKNTPLDSRVIYINANFGSKFAATQILEHLIKNEISNGR